MSVLSNESFYWVNNKGEIIYIPARYTVDSEGNAICTHTFSLEHAFDECTSVDTEGLYNAFQRCTGITSVSFPELTSIGDFGLTDAFYECTGITGSISFPKLTSIGANGLFDAFSYTGITEIHFRSDAQSVVEATEDYSSKFGASNATIYFDL